MQPFGKWRCMNEHIIVIDSINEIRLEMEGYVEKAKHWRLKWNMDKLFYGLSLEPNTTGDWNIMEWIRTEENAHLANNLHQKWLNRTHSKGDSKGT